MNEFTPRSLEDMALEWPPELDHFSANSLKMAVRCPEAWRQRYVLGKKVPPALAMLAGRADHAAIEKSMVQKIETFVDLPVPEVRDAYVETLERDVDQNGGLGELELRKSGELVTDRAVKQKAYDELRESGQDVVEVYHRQASPFFQPIAVEKEFEITPPRLPVKVIGRIDLLAHEAQDILLEPDRTAPPFMIDRKRRTRASTKIEPEWGIQAEIYQLAEPVPHAWHVSVTTKTPKVILPAEGNSLLLPVTPRARSERLLEQIASEIGFYYIRYGPDEPWPAKGKLHPWACGSCGYRPTCWGWN